MTEEILLEKKLTTDFTMGFELEAIWYGDSYDFDDYRDSINEFFSECGLEDGDLHGDGSLRDEGDGAAFEWASPVLPVNLTSINKIINMYKKGLNKKFTVNSSCGLHHHISFPNMSAEDMIWIMCKLATDSNMRNKISQFKDINFISEWSEDDYLDELANAVRNDNYREIINQCSTAKYSLVNVHPHRTLEWRGPRGFLDASTSTALKNVVEFYKLFWSFVKWMTDVLDENEINNVSKDNFMAGIKSAMRATHRTNINSFTMTSGKEKGIMSEETMNKLLQKTNDDVTFLAKLYTNKNFEQFIQFLFNKNRLGKRIELLNQSEAVSQDIKNKINSICYKYIPYRMIKNYFETLDTESLLKTTKLTAKRLFSTSRLDGALVTITGIMKELDGRLEYFKEKIFSKDYCEVPYEKTDFYIVDCPNIFKLFATKGWLKDLTSESLENSVNKLGSSEEFTTEEEVKLKVILSALLESNRMDVLRNISKKILQNAVYHPVWAKFVKLNKKQTIWLITKVRDNNPNKLDELKAVLINKGEISGPEWNKLEKFTKRATTRVSDEDLTYDEDDEDFRNRVDNAQLSGEEELI